MVWGTAFLRRSEKLKEMEQFLPNLLSLPSIQAVIAAAPRGAPQEIFVTRERALENDSLYQSYSAKFHLGEDERDRNAFAATSSPSSDLTSNNSMLTRPPLLESTNHLDGDSVRTTNDEWSVDRPFLIPLFAEHCTQLLTMTPFANAFAFNHPYTQSAITMPNRDFMIPAPHFRSDQSSTQSYFPGFSKVSLDKDKGGLGLGPEDIVMRPDEVQYRTLADDFLEQGYGQEKDFAPRRHSLDSPTGIFGSAFFKSPPRIREQQGADSWQQERGLSSSFKGNGNDNESPRGYQVLHDQMDAEQILSSGRRTKLIPQNAMQSQHYNQQQQRQQQQHDEFTFARRLSESRGIPGLQNHRPEMGFKSENFAALKQYHQDRGEFEAQQQSQNQRLRDSRYSIGQGQSQPDDYGRNFDNYPVQPTLERSRSLNIISESFYQPHQMPPPYNGSPYPDYGSNDSMKPSLGPIGRNLALQKVGGPHDGVNDAGQGQSLSPYR